MLMKAIQPIRTTVWAFLCCVAASVYADNNQQGIPDSSRWSPMYKACNEKTATMPELVKMKQLLNSRQLSPTDAAEVKSGVEEVETMFHNYCVCVAQKADEAFQLSGYNISPVEITLLSAAFRFDQLYPDQQVRELFGMSILPCMGL